MAAQWNWNACTTLGFTTDNFTCVGYAPSRGRRCQRAIGIPRRAAAFRILKKLGRTDPQSETAYQLLVDLVEETACYLHKPQVENLVSTWLDLMEDVEAPMPFSAPISGGSLVHTSPITSQTAPPPMPHFAPPSFPTPTPAVAVMSSNIIEPSVNLPVSFDIEQSSGPCTKSHVLRKELPADCTICHEHVVPSDDSVWCKAQCGTNIHRDCWDSWLETARRPLICIYCRQPWAPSCEHDDEPAPLNLELYFHNPDAPKYAQPGVEYSYENIWTAVSEGSDDDEQTSNNLQNSKYSLHDFFTIIHLEFEYPCIWTAPPSDMAAYSLHDFFTIIRLEFEYPCIWTAAPAEMPAYSLHDFFSIIPLEYAYPCIWTYPDSTQDTKTNSKDADFSLETVFKQDDASLCPPDAEALARLYFPRPPVVHHHFGRRALYRLGEIFQILGAHSA